jgi:predicted deacetylase
VRVILQRLDEIAARPRVLLVVPAGLGGADAQAHDLVDLLKAEQEIGSEIVLHGFDHRVSGSLRGRPADVMRARLFAPHDAEFLAIDQAEARRRLDSGRSILAGAGLPAAGFCAPGWLEPRWLPALLADLGFEYDIGMSVLRDLRRGTRIRLPWTGEIGAGPIQETLVGIGGTAYRWFGARRLALKVFLHASESWSSSRERILRILEGELRARRPITYRGLLGRT